MNPTGAQVAAIRDTRTQTAEHTGCPEWQLAGIRAALLATQGAPADVMSAAMLAAGDASLRVPSEPGFLGHWPRNASAERRRSAFTPCADHKEHPAGGCPACRAERAAMTEEQRLAAIAEAHQILAATTSQYVPPAVARALAQEAS
jgi:hypothetical protein